MLIYISWGSRSPDVNKLVTLCYQAVLSFTTSRKTQRHNITNESLSTICLLSEADNFITVPRRRITTLELKWLWARLCKLVVLSTHPPNLLIILYSDAVASRPPSPIGDRVNPHRYRRHCRPAYTGCNYCRTCRWRAKEFIWVNR